MTIWDRLLHPNFNPNCWGEERRELRLRLVAGINAYVMDFANLHDALS